MRASESIAPTLVLYAGYASTLSYFDDWLDAFDRSPFFRTTFYDICRPLAARRVCRLLREVELVVLHHSTNGNTLRYLRPLVPALQARRGLLVSFVGNEVNLPGVPIAGKRKIFSEIEPDFIATQLLREAGEYLFGDLVRRAVVEMPHALNPRAFRPLVPHHQRTIDIGVRSVRYLPHIGDDDRNRLYDFFIRHGGRYGLLVDISEQRLTRAAWAEFLNDCRGTVSCEAGSWYLERDDATVEAIRAWTQERVGTRLVFQNDSPLQRLGHRLPWQMRVLIKRLLRRGAVVHESELAAQLPFHEVYQRFFAGRPRAPVYSKAISSRHFDAIGTKTCQILFPGRYNDLLKPGEHYLALARDFSNLKEVLEQFGDEDHRRMLVDRTLEYVLDQHTHDHRVARLYEAIAAS